MHVLDMKKPQPHVLIIGAIMGCVCVILSGGIEVHAESSPVPGLIAPMRQDALKLPTVPDIPRTAPQSIEPPSPGSDASDAFSAFHAGQCGWNRL